MSSGGSRARARGKNYVVPLAIVLVVGQIAAFVAIKLTKDKPAKPAAADQQLAQAAPVQGSAAPLADVNATTPPTAPPTTPTPTTTTTPPTTPDPSAGTNPEDTAANPTAVDGASDVDGDGVADSDEATDDEPLDPKQAKRDAAKAKAAKDRAEKAAKDKEAKAAKAEKERKDAEDRKKEADAKRASDAEKARLAAEAEKARLAAEKAKAEAEAEEARLEAEKIKADAAAKQAAAATAAAQANAGDGSGSGAAKAKGSSTVLVLVFGPGVSGASREAIKNVYLGKTSVWPNGTTAHPMNRPAGSGAGRKFFGGILGMSASEFRAHWSQIQLSGGGISPSTVASASTMLAKVAATKGAMGYVLESELPENTNGVTLVRLK